MKKKNDKYSKSTNALRRMRCKIFDYSPEKAEQADRVLGYLKARKMRDIKAEIKNKPSNNKHWMYACE